MEVYNASYQVRAFLWFQGFDDMIDPQKAKDRSKNQDPDLNQLQQNQNFVLL